MVDTFLRWFEADLNPAFNPLTVAFNTKMWKVYKGYPNSVDWADEIRFGDAPFSAQRVALFLRAIIKKPDLVILDEAFSGMDDRVRDKCMLFLTWGETKSVGVYTRRNDSARRIFVYDTVPELLSETPFEGLSEDQALICVSHIKEEVPGVVRQWMSLPEAGTGDPARFGRFPGPLEGYERGWKEIWGLIPPDQRCVKAIISSIQEKNEKKEKKEKERRKKVRESIARKRKELGEKRKNQEEKVIENQLIP